MTLTAVRGLAAVVVSHSACFTERASDLTAEINIGSQKQIHFKSVINLSAGD